MSLNELMVRVSEIRARMELAPMRPVGAAVARSAVAPGAPTDFATTLASVNQTPEPTLTPRSAFIPGAGLLSADTDLGTRMAADAVRYVGTPYVAGGNTPQTGWDCAAFTEWMAKQHGMKIPPVSWEQIKVGEPVATLSEAKPGDLVFFHEPSGHRRDPSPLKVNHVGIYLGEGRMVEAANPSAGTRISEIDVSKLVGIRRIAGSMAA